MVKCLSNDIQQVRKEIKKGSPVYKQMLKESRSLKSWSSTRQQTRQKKQVLKATDYKTKKDKKMRKFSIHFATGCKQQMVVGRIQKWPSSIGHN